MATKKNEVLGTFNMSGLSSRVTFYEKILEEVKIRLSNKEKIIQTFGVMIIFLIYHLLKKTKKKIFNI